MIESLIPFAGVTIAYVVILEVFTVLFRLTGLTEEKARFQVISLLTNSGFTTAESELIASVRSRRKLAKITMIFGYLFSASFVTILINFIFSVQDVENNMEVWIALGIMILIIFIFYILSKIKFVKRNFDNFIATLGRSSLQNRSKNRLNVIDTYGQKSIVEILLNAVPVQFKDGSFEKNRIKQNFGLQVLAILRDKKMINDVTKDEVFKHGDVVTVYGNMKTIKDLFLIKAPPVSPADPSFVPTTLTTMSNAEAMLKSENKAILKEDISKTTVNNAKSANKEKKK